MVDQGRRPEDDTQDELIARVANTLRADRGVSPALDARVMAMIRAEAERGAAAGSIDAGAPVAPAYAPVPAVRRGGLRGAWDWAARPRTVRISPLAGLALAAGLAAIMVIGARRGDVPGVAPAPQVAENPLPAVTTSSGPIVQTVSNAPGAARVVTFVFVAPDARNVSVAGDFNDWDVGRLQLQRSGANGVWTASVPLTPGRYAYSFVVDGERWVADPASPRAPDDFGTPSSLLVVGGR